MIYAHISCNDARQICLCTWSNDSISRNVTINYLREKQTILSDKTHKPVFLYTILPINLQPKLISAIVKHIDFLMQQHNNICRPEQYDGYFKSKKISLEFISDPSKYFRPSH